MSAADKNGRRERGLCTKSLHVLEMFALAARSLRSQGDQIKDERLLSSDICSRGGGKENSLRNWKEIQGDGIRHAQK